MSCQTCGHPPEGDIQPHNFGCAESLAAREARPSEPDDCEHGGCSNPKRPQGKGPKPRFCDDHSTAKSRKE
ncbi:hypothetical protein ACFUJU_07970 [Streptomyces sp. NPDC057235]|uniref:hypothetical protein n=1 Tax=Streptomyces sp. NPDC057235 TaxID=3346058 RepID=UPI00362C1CEB